MTVLRKIFVSDEDTGQSAIVDPVSSALVGITFEHHERHEGDAFFAEVHGTGTALNLCFKTPPTKHMHVVHLFSVPSTAHFEILEAASWTTNTGTVYAPKNFNRNSTNESGALEDKTATPGYTAGGILQTATSPSGTSIYYQAAVSDAAPQGGSGGLSAVGRNEIILKANTNYAFVLTSDDGSQLMQLILEWYEHTDAA